MNSELSANSIADTNRRVPTFSTLTTQGSNSVSAILLQEVSNSYYNSK